jgi:hypothetical protein
LGKIEEDIDQNEHTPTAKLAIPVVSVFVIDHRLFLRQQIGFFVGLSTNIGLRIAAAHKIRRLVTRSMSQLC